MSKPGVDMEVDYIKEKNFTDLLEKENRFTLANHSEYDYIENNGW